MACLEPLDSRPFVNKISIIILISLFKSFLPMSQLKKHYLINHNCEADHTKLEG